MPEHNPGNMGGKELILILNKSILFVLKGTMRLGRRTTHFVTNDSIVSMYSFDLFFKQKEKI